MPAQRFGSSSSASSSSSDSDLSTESSSVTCYRHSMDSTTATPRPIASVEVLRCMRCARAVEATSTDDASTMGMVRIAHNLYYCQRCATMVGYK